MDTVLAIRLSLVSLIHFVTVTYQDNDSARSDHFVIAADQIAFHAQDRIIWTRLGHSITYTHALDCSS